MKHYDIIEWTDYVHGLAESTQARQMRHHLESGCKRCAATAHTLEKLARVVAHQSSSEVPAWVVHNAESIFALYGPKKPSLSLLIARLVYDNACEPLPAGVRSRQRLGRHALYEAGDFCVDLRLEREGGGHAVNMVGQVAHRTVPDTAIVNVPVTLLAGQRTVASGRSNEHGEFHFECEPGQSLRLQVFLARDKAIEVRLNELSDDDSVQHDLLADEDTNAAWCRPKLRTPRKQDPPSAGGELA